MPKVSIPPRSPFPIEGHLYGLEFDGHRRVLQSLPVLAELQVRRRAIGSCNRLPLSASRYRLIVRLNE